MQAIPYHVMIGREPRTTYIAQIEGGDESFQFSRIKKHVATAGGFSGGNLRGVPGRGAAMRSTPNVVTTEFAAVEARRCRI